MSSIQSQDNTLEYDIIIIGSGAGGGTLAKELSPLIKEKGIKIALLEWGGEFRAQDNIREEYPMAKKYFFDGGGVQNVQQDVTFAFAKGIGGSTTVYTGTSLTAPQQVFDRWNIEGIDLKEMAPRYEKYKKENNVHLKSADEINENNTLFRDGCKNLGIHVDQFPVNTKGCQGEGYCNLGCPNLAKQGTAAVQIPVAKNNGVHIFPFTKANKIVGKTVLATVSASQFGLEGSPLKPGDYKFKAKRFIVSCGSAVNTPALLMRSYGENFLPAIGKYFTCHPALILVGDHGRKVQNMDGHPKSFFCEEYMESDRFLLETCMYFPFVLAKNLNGYGEDMDSLMSSFPNLQMILSLCLDKAKEKNRIGIGSDGEPKIYYDLDDEIITTFVKSIRAATKVFFAAGAKRVHAPGMEKFFIMPDENEMIDQLISERHFKPGKISIAAAHLMGGARMGADPATSVTNEWGQVHGKEHLYVADASLFPQCSEVNPYLTIMALADRVADKIRSLI
ncbi:GMC family oxidoreductase [Bacteriovoracaceae bacterium]|nr:GMC family oxidoreductase [Bacteriovoracaceae bacterium]